VIARVRDAASRAGIVSGADRIREVFPDTMKRLLSFCVVRLFLAGLFPETGLHKEYGMAAILSGRRHSGFSGRGGATC